MHRYADPGEAVFAGDRLVEVLTEGATFDVTAPASGRLTARFVLPRDRVQPGQVLGVIDDGTADWPGS